MVVPLWIEPTRGGCRRRGKRSRSLHSWTVKEAARISKKPKLLRSPQPVISPPSGEDFFELLPDDLVVTILSRLGSSSTAPSDLFNVTLTCKRLKDLVANPFVLSRASVGALAVRAKNWSSSSHRFLKMCVDAGNLEACYLLGMIQFYCLPGSRAAGLDMMAKAAMGSYAAALFSFAIIHLNSSGGRKANRNTPGGVALAARAAFLDHVDAIRELGHCLHDGYGDQRSFSKGRKLIAKANTLEVLRAIADEDGSDGFAAALPGEPQLCPLLSDFGYDAARPDPHPANEFLLGWFRERRESLARECSYAGCGRPETRPREFRHCSACEEVIYCSRACQTRDWKLGHWQRCVSFDWCCLAPWTHLPVCPS